jgi:hypothetical protein
LFCIEGSLSSCKCCFRLESWFFRAANMSSSWIGAGLRCWSHAGLYKVAGRGFWERDQEPKNDLENKQGHVPSWESLEGRLAGHPHLGWGLCWSLCPQPAWNCLWLSRTTCGPSLCSGNVWVWPRVHWKESVTGCWTLACFHPLPEIQSYFPC